MPKATTYRDHAHARVYLSWLNKPAWRTMSLAGRCLLIEMMADYRGPGSGNGTFAWSCRRAAKVLGVSKTTGARALIELETRGWIVVVKVAGFGGRNKPAEYRLTMFPCDVSGEPPSRAFERWEG